ncbi:hypothetical protein [Mycobacterium montefiorense]|uniref:Uncharacterized protein n=1 Tax=Mycobacterium montefiorense TaxID=154654 RepID=A0AA37V0J6_9MYCO|nr:hypothetical protein [Mycobacterium montefiorense]MCV7426714.1 hypothetical protein [Mycobacterium montefiorense]GBG36740.1 hypothetical protein MmonteBS_11120 [Mycobacterium montefiorense]GKU37500.1 hypothetical protein NJB14191_48460 [Mycobacterium montefiorense]GKU42632.1 hypothetical protein NJB14192_46150 [Mycobacterium montefiorense]GKU48690.1 hypothetical protein NJB14194_53050 [Mycobacterium montefiorense]
MKRLVVSDKSGHIIATGPHPDEKPNSHVMYGFNALDGQQIHELELPEHVRTIEHVVELHTTHVVRVQGNKATLMAAKSS